jgi:hypothetical protein
MQMLPHIEDATPRFLVGLHATMSLQVNGMQALWQAFMPQRTHVAAQGAIPTLCTLRSYPEDYFEVLGDAYRQGVPENEEDIWMPFLPR